MFCCSSVRVVSAVTSFRLPPWPRPLPDHCIDTVPVTMTIAGQFGRTTARRAPTATRQTTRPRHGVTRAVAWATTVTQVRQEFDIQYINLGVLSYGATQIANYVYFVCKS